MGICWSADGFPPGFCRFYAIDRMTPCGFGEKTGGSDAPGVSRTGGRDRQTTVFLMVESMETVVCPLLPEMPHLAMPAVVGLRVDAVDLSHQPGQVRAARMQDQMVMVAHQAKGQCTGIEAVKGCSNHVQKCPPLSWSSSKIGSRRSPREVTW
jgi:hypothetical protein